MKPVKKIAVIHDICGVGKAAMTNILPILSIMGIEVCPIPTMLLSTHTGGYGQPYIQPLDGYMSGCLKHYLDEDISFDMIFVGYLGSIQRIQEVKQFLTIYKEKYKKVTVVLDPIFGDNGSCYSNFNMEYVSHMRTLLSYADVILPNYTEFCLLFEGNSNNMESSTFINKNTFTNRNTFTNSIRNRLKELSVKEAIITSYPVEEMNEIGILITDQVEVKMLKYSRSRQSYHGTGDVFAAVFCGSLMIGESLEESCNRAHEFVKMCIEESSKYEYPKREGIVLEPLLGQLIK